MRNKYDWPILLAEYHVAELKSKNLSMSSFASARGIPSSTFRKGILREKRRNQAKEQGLQSNNLKLALKHMSRALSLLNSH
ncbi:hypothetical protein RJD39_08650 [Vibrio scophthalmi]|uniref:hypothetical protein n=1 Tax=Vibrio scophthalmi TaxID=45658 RepID=UPI003873AEDF